MKYKALLTGSMTAVIDDFFSHMDGHVFCLTTSQRYEDMKGHITEFKPEVFIICLNNESRTFLNYVQILKKSCDAVGTKLVIIGEQQQDCNDFVNTTAINPDLALAKPISTQEILHAIDDLMNLSSKERETAKNIDDAKSLLEEIEMFNKNKIEEEKTKKRILVVDDDMFMLKAIKSQLEDRYTVSSAASGSTALNFLEKKIPDLILLDYEMPEMDGTEVFKAIKANKSTKNIPVVFLTGVSDGDRIKKVISMKPQGYVLKPVEKKLLLEVITKIIGP